MSKMSKSQTEETFECWDGKFRTNAEDDIIKKKIIDLEDRYLEL